jgi:hypothetical protein
MTSNDAEEPPLTDAAGVASPVHLQFCEFERIDWGASLSSASAPVVAAYPVRKGLIRKAQLSFLLKKYATKRPNSVLHKTVPETHIMTVRSILSD